jgi:hypothetical protein
MQLMIYLTMPLECVVWIGTTHSKDVWRTRVLLIPLLPFPLPSLPRRLVAGTDAVSGTILAQFASSFSAPPFVPALLSSLAAVVDAVQGMFNTNLHLLLSLLCSHRRKT